jgi:2-polyprenyl-3-methyl-5-hydroxy-6-metoxy-1,4-benzoquinol methylase
MPIPIPPNPALVFDFINSYQRSAAIRAAVELDLFAALGEGLSSVSDLARRCGASERGIRVLCDYLTIHGLIEKDGAAYRHSTTSAAFLDPRSPSCVASTVRFLNNPMMMEPYDHLATVIRRGHTTLPGQGTVEPENTIWVEFAHSMAPMMAPLAAPLGRAVLNGNRSPMRVLDVAAGHGLFGIEVAKQNPAAEVVALDWAPVLKVAHSNAAKAGVLSRYRLRPGSAFEEYFDSPFDIILLTNFLHHFDPPTCTGLLRKCKAALVPGGRVAALEFVPNEDRVTPPASAAFALIMLATTVAGDAYTFQEYKGMFLDAGLTRIEMCDIPPSPHRIVSGYADHD